MNAKQNHTKQTRIKVKPKEEAIVNRLLCATLEGVNAQVVEVEATFTKGLPGFAVVGLASSDIQEAKERVKSALLVNDFVFPPLKITIGLSPSEMKKSGSHFDLPLALLIALNKKAFVQEDLYVFGELGLDGRIKSSSMLFPLILSLKEQGRITRAMVPKEAMVYLKHISGVEFIAVETLKEAITLMQEGKFEAQQVSFEYDAKRLEIGEETYYYRQH
jgi:magnesium chelatase family protein